MNIEMVYLSIDTGRLLAVGTEDNGENNNGSYHVELYRNAIIFAWGYPCNEGDVSDDNIEKDVKEWGLPFLKGDDSEWTLIAGKR